MQLFQICFHAILVVNRYDYYNLWQNENSLKFGTRSNTMEVTRTPAIYGGSEKFCFVRYRKTPGFKFSAIESHLRSLNHVNNCMTVVIKTNECKPTMRKLTNFFCHVLEKLRQSFEVNAIAK